jgi:DNA-binding LytR/AlgR family response regulator
MNMVKQRLKGMRILIVEDEYLIAADLADGFMAAGAEVVGPIGTVEQALTLLADSTVPTPDAASLDMNLRGTLVFPVADALLNKGVPFVFCTGYDHAKLPAAHRDVPRFEKPLDVARLSETLARQTSGIRPNN